ncbi:MAG: hypothetical protein JKY87_00320 [Mariprofundus sp.]|nr:hypothetical protein [Mariprofundus sp.]
MPNVLKIKRSNVTAIPAALAEGEMAYSEKAGVKLLYIGTNAGAGIEKIGGKAIVDKVDAIAPGATANAADVALLSRANHTGTQPVATITGLGDAALLNAGVDLATLVAGKIPSSQIPNIAITSVNVVATQAAQLALTVQAGDVAIRTDVNKSFFALNSTNAAMTDWREIISPTNAPPVSSVNAQVGTVVLGAADVGAESANANIQTHIASPHAPSSATVNASDAFLRARSNHTGTQPSSTIGDFSASVDAVLASSALDGGTF